MYCGNMLGFAKSEADLLCKYWPEPDLLPIIGPFSKHGLAFLNV
jgi:hypothetical protein